MTRTQKQILLLDNGHGKDTPGKRSPIYEDGRQLLEWEFNRDIVRRISELCTQEGIEHVIVVPEDEDIPLRERCNRINETTRRYLDIKNQNCFLVSIHANAGGGTGFEIYTTKGHTRADTVAVTIGEEWIKEFGKEWPVRPDYSDGDLDKESQFYILKHTVCPAVLSENLFMDNPKDCKFLMSEEGRQRIAKVHFNAIKRIVYEVH